MAVRGNFNSFEGISLNGKPVLREIYTTYYIETKRQVFAKQLMPYS